MCAAACRYLLAEDAEADKGPGAFSTGASAAVEQKLALVLVHACQQELANLGSTLQEDQALLGKKGVGDIEGAAVRFRIDKKKLLQGVLSQLTQ